MSNLVTKLAENGCLELWMDPSDPVKRHRIINKCRDGTFWIEPTYGFYLTKKIYYPFIDSLKDIRKKARLINKRWYEEVFLGGR